MQAAADYAPRDYGATVPMPQKVSPPNSTASSIPSTMQKGKIDRLSSPFATPRRRMNLLPILLCLFFPWLMFSATYAVAAFSIHDESPGLFYVLVGFGFTLVLAAGIRAYEARYGVSSQHEKDPSWHIFLALSLFFAWTSGLLLGNSNYSTNMQPFYSLQNLNTYSDIDPSKMRGEQLMDAGMLSFAKGSSIDVAKSMSFRHSKVYCVAPVTMGKTTPISYDIWVVGTNCCTVGEADFHCAASVGPGTKGGFRLISGDDDRAYYRLAVQQAEASYRLNANHPLFFTWVNEDPFLVVADWFRKGKNQFLIWTCAFFGLQAFAVAIVTLIFSRAHPSANWRQGVS